MEGLEGHSLSSLLQVKVGTVSLVTLFQCGIKDLANNCDQEEGEQKRAGGGGGKGWQRHFIEGGKKKQERVKEMERVQEIEEQRLPPAVKKALYALDLVANKAQIIKHSPTKRMLMDNLDRIAGRLVNDLSDPSFPPSPHGTVWWAGTWPCRECGARVSHCLRIPSPFPIPKTQVLVGKTLVMSEVLLSLSLPIAPYSSPSSSFSSSTSSTSTSTSTSTTSTLSPSLDRAEVDIEPALGLVMVSGRSVRLLIYYPKIGALVEVWGAERGATKVTTTTITFPTTSSSSPATSPTTNDFCVHNRKEEREREERERENQWKEDRKRDRKKREVGVGGNNTNSNRNPTARQVREELDNLKEKWREREREKQRKAALVQKLGFGGDMGGAGDLDNLPGTFHADPPWWDNQPRFTGSKESSISAREEQKSDGDRSAWVKAVVEGVWLSLSTKGASASYCSGLVIGGPGPVGAQVANALKARADKAVDRALWVYMVPFTADCFSLCGSEGDITFSHNDEELQQASTRSQYMGDMNAKRSAIATLSDFVTSHRLHFAGGVLDRTGLSPNHFTKNRHRDQRIWRKMCVK